jgi:hypothetical protein
MRSSPSGGSSFRTALRVARAHRIHRAVDRREDVARVVEKALPRRKERHPARGPRKQRRPELVLERADLAADRRLSHVQALRGAAHVAFFSNGDEVTDLHEAHAASLSSTHENRKRPSQIEKVLDRAPVPAA